MAELGTLDQLPADYLDDLEARNLVPLWPNLRSVMPYGRPARKSQAVLWRYRDIRPLLLKAGELTPIEKAERRVLSLANPGLGLGNMMATPSIYIGMQLILPGESAPCHKHTPAAVRCVVEGSGGFTTVEGEKCPMEKGDLILTPSGTWHEHGHQGADPVVWMDALDLPLIYYLESSYCIDGESQPLRNVPDASQTRYRRAGLVPYASLGKARAPYPLYRYPWTEVRQALQALEADTAADGIVWLAYVNPETGGECLPTLGLSAVMLRPGETARPVRRSASAVVHVIEGEGESLIDGTDIAWEEDDTFAVPTHADLSLTNRSTARPAYLLVVDDAPIQRKLAFYEEFPPG